MIDTPWLWIAIVVAAAGFQSVRNAAQRNLVETAGVMPATFVRFFYGLPFAVLGLIAAMGAIALSRRFFKERVSRIELVGIVLVVAGIVVISARH